MYAKLTKYKAHQKLDFPIAGPFIIIGRKGNAFQLKNIKNSETVLVHPDYIVTGKIKTIVKIPNESTPAPIDQKHRYNLRSRTNESRVES